MDIAPINIQMVYPTAATEASNTQHNLNQAAALQQNFEAVREKQDAELKRKQVRTKDEADGGGTIKNDSERQGRGGTYQRNASKRRGQSNPSDPQREKFAVDPLRGRHFDISL